MEYSELKTAIEDYCQNSETSFSSHIPDFIIAAEDRVFSLVELPSTWKSVTKEVLVDETAEYVFGSANGAPGIVDVLSVRISEDPDPANKQASDVEYGPVRYLVQKDYDFLLEAYPGISGASDDNPWPGKTGIPKYYAISSGSVVSGEAAMTIRLGPIPDAAAYSMTVTYNGKPTTDSITGGDRGTTTAKTTWLSVVFPDVLLYGSLVQAYTYMKGEPDLIQLYEKQFMEGLTLLKNFGDKRTDSDTYRPAPFASASAQAPQ